MSFQSGLVAACAMAMLAAGGAQAANLVVNGDFEAGNTSFSSDYTFTTNGSPPKTYYITTSPKNFNGAFVNVGDHTSGSGLMFVGNGGPNVGDIVWQSQSIAIDAAQDYFFEAFLLNAYPSNPPILTFTVSLDGGAEVVLDAPTIPEGTGVWTGLSTTFNSGAATTATLYLRNAQTAFGGNDFALDDIYLGTTSVVNPGAGGVPEPASWALMILGFAGAGTALRRRAADRVRIAPFA
ncbi:MAG: PEP-CTERM sorting domain-containing protein [Phenylobacterium sp.]|uniref:PEPxxWA-CTERM sorting domain-containing protein n=1 Tax=Phenylobacterium sp. TaxID=1871053 RepID=UPI0025F95CF5|nr:PEPxxWA-CTERM sorting domain-containing protein [Phenylobacterium sp.]MBI1199983.1 PEP-CTERM sorting domain-containing protein [Phenylobacterium sp.]